MTPQPRHPQQTALILGVDDRAALSVVRSLGRRGVTVDVGCDFDGSIVPLSRHVRDTIRLPHAGTRPDEWLAALKAQLAATRYDLVIPTADNYLVLCVEHREALGALATFAIPDDRGFEYTYRKSRTFELAESLGVPLPRSLRVETLADLENRPAEFAAPVIIKPISSKVWSEEGRHNLDVRLATSEEMVTGILEKVLPVCPVLLQTFHRGVGEGVELLMRDGEVVAAFQHRRVHEPLGGGGSSYRRSVPLDPDLFRHATALLKALDWTGVAMVEFKTDLETGRSVLMEINGRFWGSLPLAVAAGVDFPFLLFDMLVNGRVPAERPAYKETIYCRNLVKDIDWLKRHVHADRNDPFIIVRSRRELLGDLLRLFAYRERFDTLAWDDLRPGRIHLTRYLLSNLQGAGTKLRRLWWRMHYGANPLTRRWRIRRIRRLLADRSGVNFICKGNICRSPFAEYYLKARLAEGGTAAIPVTSTGFIERVERPSPEAAVAAAQELGIDLRPHRSRLLSEADFRRYSLHVVMDLELFERVRETYPAYRDRLVFLEEARPGGGSGLEIADPYGKPLAVFERTYRRIAAAVDGLVALVPAPAERGNRPVSAGDALPNR